MSVSSLNCDRPLHSESERMSCNKHRLPILKGVSHVCHDRLLYIPGPAMTLAGIGEYAWRNKTVKTGQIYSTRSLNTQHKSVSGQCSATLHTGISHTSGLRSGPRSSSRGLSTDCGLTAFTVSHPKGKKEKKRAQTVPNLGRT